VPITRYKASPERQAPLAAAGTSAPRTFENGLAPGDRVRVHAGLLKGIEGMIIRSNRKMDVGRMLVALDQGVSLEIDDSLIEVF
jgi:hypothetical protein